MDLSVDCFIMSFMYTIQKSTEQHAKLTGTSPLLLISSFYITFLITINTSKQTLSVKEPMFILNVL